jgi:CRP/FNR family transcriptional regulator, anaerobic regulatory protein
MSEIPTFFPALFCKEVCDDRELAALRRLASPVRLRNEQTIFSEGEFAESAFGLSRGFMRLYKTLPDGRRRIVAFALPGDLLDIPLADHFTCSADAIGEVTVCRFPREQLKKVILSSPNLTRLLMEFEARELRSARNQLTLLGASSAEERLTTFLLNWRNCLGQAPVSQPVPLPMRRQDIADFLGLQLETVSRTLARLERKGAIEILPNGVLLSGLAQAPREGSSCAAL